MTVPHPLSDRLVEFVGLLREHGITAGPSDSLDAAGAMVVLGLTNSEQLRAGLAATLLRRNGQREVFDQIFDIYWGTGGSTLATDADQPATLGVEALRDLLTAALAEGNEAAIQQLAEQALAELGGYGNNGSGGKGPAMSGFSAYLTMKALSVDDLLERVLAAMGASQMDGFDTTVATLEATRRIGDFRAAVEGGARQRAAQQRGAERIARHGVERSTDQQSFLAANERQLAEMRCLVTPLARKLATRLAARRRKAVRGQIDLRRTLRRSMATGGVPMRPVLKARRKGRPDLVVLADMSGSVAGFAEFTLQLVSALQDQFSKVRSFGFVDTSEEITHLIRPGELSAGLARRIMREATVSRWGSSNYGDALGTFTERYPDVIGPRTSLLILGDARSNYADPNIAALRTMVDRAKHAYWLNPEPASSWSTGDSVAHRYAEHITMHECRNVRQLAEVIGKLLPA